MFSADEVEIVRFLQQQVTLKPVEAAVFVHIDANITGLDLHVVKCIWVFWVFGELSLTSSVVMLSTLPPVRGANGALALPSPPPPSERQGPLMYFLQI